MGLIGNLFKPTPDRFVKLVVRELNGQGVTGSVELDPTNFALRYERGDAPGYINLRNVYVEFCSLPRSARRGHLRQFVRSILESTSRDEISLEEAMSRFLPRIRPDAYYGLIDLQLQIQQYEPMELAKREYAEGIKVELIVDHDDAIQTVSQKQLDEWGTDLDSCLKQARENLWKLSNQDFKQIAPDIYCSPWQDNHDTARLYLEDLIWQLKVKGRHIATMPNRDMLLVCGDGDPEALKQMLDITLKAYEHDRPMVAKPYVLENRRWQRLLLPNGHPAAGVLDKLRHLQDGQDYQQQTDHMNQLFEQQGTDIFVATYSVREDEVTGNWSSYAVWSEGVDTIMPPADYIGLVSNTGPEGRLLGFVPWEKVREVAGELMESTEYVPVRYRVRKFPNKKQLVDLGIS